MVVTVTCPACWQPTSLDVAAWEGEIDLVVDCQVCCRSLRVRAQLTPARREGEGDGQDVVFGEPVAEVEVELAG